MSRSLLACLAFSVTALLFASACGSSVKPEDRSSWSAERLEFQEIADRLTASENRYIGTATRDQRLEQLDAAPDGAARVTALVALAWEHLRLGEVDEATRRTSEAYELSKSVPLNASIRDAMLVMYGTSHLRQAEVQNCITRNNSDCCIFPLQGGGVHTATQPGKTARKAYQELLQHQPNDLTVVWLLNVLSMALGDYPNGVPARFRIPPEAFEPEGQIPRFVDVAPQHGVNTFNQCGGAIADDFDGDGRLDILTSTFDPHGPLHLYRNEGAAGFSDRSEASRVSDQLGGLNIVGADYDNDGDLDVLVLRGAWLADDGEIRNSLLRNEGDGTFTDVTRSAGLDSPAHPTQAAVWGDFDNDGDLDLYIVNEQPTAGTPLRPANFFVNQGDGTFVERTREAGLTNDGMAKGVAAGDYDNDGDLDIYVSNIGLNRLYRNNGDSTFTDVAAELGVFAPAKRSFATWFFDYDNDGWLDIFVGAYDASTADLARHALGQPFRATVPRLYRNKGDGTFEDVAAKTGLARPFLPMGANFGDVDNDGWLDIYLTTGDPKFESLMPNVLLRNDGARRFLNVTSAAGLGHLQKGHGVAFADFDDDGDQDIYHQLGGFYPGDRFHNALFANPGQGHRHLTLALEGVESNRQALGARVRVTVETPNGARSIHRAVGSVSSFGGSPRRQEIGLGAATKIVEVRVEWPTSGTVQTFEDLQLDAAYRITEAADAPQRIDRSTSSLLASR